MSPSRHRMRRLSLSARLCLVCMALLAIAVGIMLALEQRLPGRSLLNGLLAFVVMIPVTVVAMRMQVRPLIEMFHALEGTVASYQDGDYSFSLHWTREDELADLVRAHNSLGTVLREQRQKLTQRELLLDSMVQNTPVAMLLVDAESESGPIVFANLAARQLLNEGRKLEGHRLAAVIGRASKALNEALSHGKDGLFTVSQEDDEKTFHLARSQFTLNGRRHELLLIRHLTAELRRQEVQTWKKVIRVISHELNNSLAPLTSLAHSAKELVRKEDMRRLPQILEIIEERSRHLERFISGYARFAKIPSPQFEASRWRPLVERLQAQFPFVLVGALPEETARFDPAQLEQALINLLKNAHESGSPPADIELQVECRQDMARIDVRDRGPGMNEAALTHALVPFYSTKREGTGLGLALAREIAEAHNGRIHIANREGGGLSVSLVLPA